MLPVFYGVNMKPIKLKKNQIEIPFVDEEGETVLTLHFDKTDKNIDRFFKAKDEVFGLDKEIGDTAEYSDSIEIVKKSYDAILGEGTFEKVYKINPSMPICLSYLLDIADGILENLMQDMRTEKINKYIKGTPESVFNSISDK